MWEVINKKTGKSLGIWESNYEWASNYWPARGYKLVRKG